jgi:hypothetical protein
VALEVALDGQHFTSAAAVAFDVHPPPAVYRAEMLGGVTHRWEDSAAVITVTGTGFVRSLWASCNLQGVSFPNLGSYTSPATVADSSTLLCASPPVVPAATYVFTASISGDARGDGVPAGATASEQLRLGVLRNADVVTLLPSHGHARGGTRVSLYGTGFLSGGRAPRCRFGAREVPPPPFPVLTGQVSSLPSY